MVQQLIMQKAADDMRKQQELAAEEKEKAIEERVPKLELGGLDQSQCMSYEFHNSFTSCC